MLKPQFNCLSKAAKLAGFGIGTALANKTRKKKRPQANMQRASRKKNRGVK